MLNLRNYDVRRTRARARWRRLNAQLSSQEKDQVPCEATRRRAFAESPWSTIAGTEAEQSQLHPGSIHSSVRSVSIAVMDYPASGPPKSPIPAARTPLLGSMSRSRETTISSRGTEKSVSFRGDTSRHRFPGSSAERFDFYV